MDKPSREQDELEGAGAPLFFNVPREQETKLEVSPPADSRVGGDGWWELPPLSRWPSDPA